MRGSCGDPQNVFNHTQGSARSIAEQFRDVEHPITWYGWPRTAQNAASMVEAVRRRLTAQRLKVFPHCHNTIREFGAWSYKRTARGELPPGDDQFEDRDNEAMDVLKGLVAAESQYDTVPIVLVGGEQERHVVEYGMQSVPAAPHRATL